MRFLLALFIATPLFATDRPDTGAVTQWIVQQGQVGFSQAGAAMLPQSVLQAMMNGQIAPIQQYSLVNNLFNQCITDLDKYKPGKSDSYSVAKSKFQYAMCRVQSCQTQGMLILALPMLSDNPAAGGSASSAGQSANDALVTGLAQGFQNTDSCSGDSNPGIDSMLIQLILNN
ncbi:hypothetical protein K2X33_01785 [bacterium]|nr:hypothetical protein [bacterium]